MTKSKTQIALEMMQKDSSITAYQAAAIVGVTEQAIYGAIRRTKDKPQCPCCGQVVRSGFEVDPAIGFVCEAMKDVPVKPDVKASDTLRAIANKLDNN